MFPEDCSAFAHDVVPGHVDSSWLQATSSTQAVTCSQQDTPRHCSQVPCVASPAQNDAGSGWQSPPSSEGFHTHGRPPAQSPVAVPVGKQAPPASAPAAMHAPSLPHSVLLLHSDEQIPEASWALAVNGRHTALVHVCDTTHGAPNAPADASSRPPSAAEPLDPHADASRPNNAARRSRRVGPGIITPKRSSK